ncbi:c-type cytochrome [Falsiroseomonas sp. HC035]|uniref:c-type cytochrome n=1 Tax=Falsiroseomonas sp. HC035 TaxID=3390999 RepID=UPI003D32282A
MLFLMVSGIAVAAVALPTLQWQQQDRRRILAAERVGGDPEAGQAALLRHGCGGCHRIPGVSGAMGNVGPDLSGLAQRSFIAGRAINQPDLLIRWIRDPRSIDPRTAMPDLGVNEAEARDMGAYLYSISPRVF